MDNDIKPLDCIERMVWGPSGDALHLADKLDPAEFPDRPERTLFSYIAARVAAGQPTDPVSVRTALKAEADTHVYELFESAIINGRTVDRLYDPIHQIPVVDFVAAFKTQSYAKRFKEIIAGVQLAIVQHKPITKIKQRLEQRLELLDAGSLDTRSYDDTKRQTDAVIDDYHATDEDGLKWGNRQLDEHLIPPRKGNLLVIGGAPGTGKSTIARNFYSNWASSGEKVCVFSTEMTGKEQRIALACMDSGVPIDKYYKKTMDPVETAAFLKGLTFWQTENLKINERASITPDWTLKNMKRYRAMGYTIFVIDHLHRVDYGGGSDLRVPVGNFVTALKSFALQHQCMVVALSQLKKISKHEEPGDEYLRETGKIAEEADRVLFVYRPLVYGDLNATGRFIPRTKPDGGRWYEHEKLKDGAVLGDDDENVYIKPDKGRIRPKDILFRIGFNEKTGKMAA